LGGVALLALGAGASGQVAASTPFHVSHLRGVYVDGKGNPIAGAAVTLHQDDKVKFSTRTDRAGRFEIKRVTGRFQLHVDMKGQSPVSRQVVVGIEAEIYLHGATLYVIAGPAACSDDCSKVFTSKDKFEKALRENKEPRN
jgi:hypothetical protein